MKSQYSRAWDAEKKCEYVDERKQPLVTWVFEEGTFVPAAKITDKRKLSIATNYMGTPEAMYREDGEKVWSCELNSYGKVKSFQGEYKTECPFRFQGQYEDGETGLYYNRFRYYSPAEGIYISQDPIGLQGGHTLYSYVHDTNAYGDVFGLKTCEELDAMAKEASEQLPEGKGRNMTTVAVGEDADGNLSVSTSTPYVPRKIQDWADANNVAVVNSRQENVHAEESIFNNATNKPVKMGSSKPICIDCQKGMDANNVDYNHHNVSNTQSTNRQEGGKYEGTHGDW